MSDERREQGSPGRPALDPGRRHPHRPAPPDGCPGGGLVAGHRRRDATILLTGRELAGRLGLRYSADRLSDPDYNIRLGALYIRQVLDMFDGNVELALAGYNGGPYRIKRLWRQAGTDPELDRFIDGLSLDETKTYVKRIVLFSNSYRLLYNQPG